jgi:Tfp pilus assembly protein PilX
MRHQDSSKLLSQKGNTLIAAMVLVVVVTALALSQFRTAKTDTLSTNLAQNNMAAASQAATLAVNEGAQWINSLSTKPSYCSQKTGCGSGIYDRNVLTGGASAQKNDWWTTSNAHSATPYSGTPIVPLYAVEYVSCDTATGATSYNVTGHGGVILYNNPQYTNLTRVVQKTWAGNAVTFISKPLCPAYGGRGQGIASPSSFSGSFVANSTQPGSTFPAGKSGNITSFGGVINSTTGASKMNLSISVNGVQKFSGQVTTPLPGGGACSIGATRQMVWTSLPSIPINYGDTVAFQVTNCLDANWGVSSCMIGTDDSRNFIFGFAGTVVTCP